MKKTIQIMAVAVLSFLSISVFGQQTESKDTTIKEKTWDAKKNPVVEEINAKYESHLIATSKDLTTEDIFPAIGKYESTTNPEAASVSINIDPENKGLVWVEGLPQGKIKAMLRKSPSTYKIPAQKTEDGKDVAEGTLIFDKETNTLSICIGKEYNTENPTEAFAAPQMNEDAAATTDNKTAAADKKKVKTKKAAQPKAWIYTATKVEKKDDMSMVH